jgi:hypothetical protein
VLSQMIGFCSSFWLNNVPLHTYTTFFLSIHQLVHTPLNAGTGLLSVAGSEILNPLLPPPHPLFVSLIGPRLSKTSCSLALLTEWTPLLHSRTHKCVTRQDEALSSATERGKGRPCPHKKRVSMIHTVVP